MSDKLVTLVQGRAEVNEETLAGPDTSAQTA